MYWYGCALDACDKASASQLGAVELHGHPCDPQCSHRTTAFVDCVWCLHCEKIAEPQYPSGRKKKDALPYSGRFCKKHQRAVEVCWWRDGESRIQWHGTVPCSEFEKEGPGHPMAVEALPPESEAW